MNERRGEDTKSEKGGSHGGGVIKMHLNRIS